MSQSVVSAAKASGVVPGAGTRVHRFEVWPLASVGDPRGEATKAEAGRLGIVATGVRTARVYLIQADLTATQVERVRSALLTNPVVDDTRVGVTACAAGVQTVEVLPLPGVMDPAAQTVEEAVRELTGVQDVHAVTGVRYDFEGVTRAQADEIAARLLFNPAIQGVHASAYVPEAFPVARAADQTLRRVALRALSDEQLAKLSRDAHLFLSLEEMQALRAEYQRVGREPTDIELETLAQTWSEHCVHKTLKSRIVYREGTEAQRHGGTERGRIKWEGRPGHVVNADGSVTIDNLLKRTVAAATHELIGEGVDWTLSVFKDNSGVIRFDETYAVCIKVETHNHPSAIEPYGGAATGVGGCIRDVIATGLGAQPIANTDVFCVGYPGDWVEGKAERHGGTEARSDFDAGALSRREGTPYALPKGVLHPRRVLSRVVDGVRDYGNRMGIPTVNGAVYFDNRYVGNPLVFCGCIGLMRADMVHGGAKPGDRIIALGGRTGRDGIHGATFSSAELTDTHADEFSHAVQIGNAIEEKRTLDAIMRARDAAGGPLYHGMTDCGAGGFSSAVGEMGSKLGAEVHLDRAPLKYAGLRYDEIWISESQERFVLAVPAANVPALQKICDEEGVLLADLGHFGTPNADLILNFRGEEVGRLSMHFLHEGIPMPTREAVWNPGAVGSGQWAFGSGPRSAPTANCPSSTAQVASPPATEIRTRLLQLLAHPNIASKRWIVRQYDHEVRGNTVVKPLVGPGGIGPGDATVIQPVPGSKQGLAIGCGMAVHLGDVQNGGDPYEAALAAVDECVRNLVCVGADPDRIAILDNFCWPSCGKPENLASLVRAAEGCYDAAKAYRTPFVSGKDSLNNQLRLADGRVIEIPPTLLITGMGVVPDVGKCVTMDLKAVDEPTKLAIIQPGAAYEGENAPFDTLPSRLVRDAVACARLVHRLMQSGMILAAHDCSEGGPLVALAEMLIGASEKSTIGAAVYLPDLLRFNHTEMRPFHQDTFAEMPGAYLLQFRLSDYHRVREICDQHEFESNVRAGFKPQDGETRRFVVADLDAADVVLRSALKVQVDCSPSSADFEISISDLRQAFLGTLDW
jgi:phosphoribosylformylglycinamidine synthase